MDNASQPQIAPKTEKKKKGRSFKTNLLLMVSTLLLLLILIGGILGYAYRSDVRDEMCKYDFTTFIIDDVLKETDCESENVAESEEDEDDFDFTTSDEQEGEILIDNNAIDVSEIYELANPAVVGVGIINNRSRDGEEEQVIGSGFVVSPDGLIATNQHVVSVLNVEYFVKFPDSNEAVEVQEIYRDEVNDVAILKVNKTNLPSLVLGDSDELRPGEPVVAIGNPLGELRSTVTSGIVSGLNRTVEVNNGNSFLRTEVTTFEDTIQTDAAINPGNSGGPLLNAKGQVIGINFATIAGADNLSFALPISYVTNRLEELNSFGRFRIPYIGIEYTNDLVQFGNESYVGATVIGLDENGSAIDILEEGDIIIEIDGKSLENNSLASIIQRLNIGDFVDIDVIRGSRIVTETVEIIEREGE